MSKDSIGEFIRYQQTSKALGVPVYFTRPYASWERGTAENKSANTFQKKAESRRLLMKESKWSKWCLMTDHEKRSASKLQMKQWIDEYLKYRMTHLNGVQVRTSLTFHNLKIDIAY